MKHSPEHCYCSRSVRGYWAYRSVEGLEVLFCFPNPFPGETDHSEAVMSIKKWSGESRRDLNADEEFQIIGSKGSRNHFLSLLWPTNERPLSKIRNAEHVRPLFFRTTSFLVYLTPPQQRSCPTNTCDTKKKTNLTSLSSTSVKTQMASKSSKKMGNSRPFRNYLTRFDLIPSIITFSREKKRERNKTRWKLRHAIQVSKSFSFLFLENLFGENEPDFITLILEIPFRSRF